MSLSPDFHSSTWYYSACVKGVVASNSNDEKNHIVQKTPESTLDVECCIDNLFDSELRQMLSPDLLSQLKVSSGFEASTQDSINWMFKVHAHYDFRPATAYLAAIYWERFLVRHKLPQGEAWPMQLLSVACLALATKMEETNAPSLVDLQIMEPIFVFSLETVQRMELLIMSALNWRLRVTTPFDFIQHFIRRIPSLNSKLIHLNHAVHLVDEVILSASEVIGFSDHLPSAVAASAVLWATCNFPADENIRRFHKRIDKGLVKRCHQLIEQNISKFASPAMKLCHDCHGGIKLLDASVTKERKRTHHNNTDQKTGAISGDRSARNRKEADF